MTNILYVFDDNYAPYAGISITSLLANAKSEDEIHFYLAGFNISDENQKRIENTVHKYGQEISWLDCSDALGHIDSCNTGYWNGSKATWLKVFVLWKLPLNVARILYIDSDTLVAGDISQINEIDISGYPLGMVYDSLGNTRGKKHFALEKYYNAGIILFDVNYWRDKGFQNDFLSYFQENVEKYYDDEQGLLNDYFREKILLLPLKFNLQGFLSNFSTRNYLKIYNNFPFYSYEEIEEQKENAVVYHFFRIFGDYPWREGNMHPFKERYDYWKSRSLWKDIEYMKKNRKVIFKIEKLLFRILPESVFLWLFRFIVERIM